MMKNVAMIMKMGIDDHHSIGFGEEEEENDSDDEYNDKDNNDEIQTKK